jgi:8-oxo-dGTP diphosphatase
LWLCSCHDEKDLARAIELGADAAVVSPVHKSAAHPDRAALGWDGLERLCARAPMPLYAQGGLEPAQLAAAQAVGAIGIATTRWQAGFDTPERETGAAAHRVGPLRAHGNRSSLFN